jgi:O-antigen/teichoic acid export membrane protein
MIVAQWLGLAALALEIATRQPLWVLGAAFAAPPLIAGAMLSVIAIQRRYIAPPSVESIDGQKIRAAFHLGSTLFLLDVANFSLQRTPELMVARLRGLGEVAALSAANRLSLFLVALLQAILVAAWPMMSEAAAKHDWAWVRRGLFGSLGAILAVWLAGALAIWFGGPFFIEKWTGIAGLVGPRLFQAVILLGLALGLQSWAFMTLNALSLYRAQLYALMPAAVFYFLLALVLGPLYGAVGVVLAQSIALLLLAVPVGLAAVIRRVKAQKLVGQHDRA